MILHLSDLHFGTEREACLQAIRQLCEEHPFEAVVVSGDLTQRARFIQFYACRQFLDSLKLPYLVVPGNHDIPLYNVWNRFFSPFARYQLFFGGMENTLETEHFYVIGVNSIRRRYHTRGHISLNQIQEIDLKLQQAPAHKIKLIAAHQPFYTPPDHSHGVKDCPMLGRIALEQWSQHGLNGLLTRVRHEKGGRNPLERSLACMVPEARLELARCCQRWILSPLRLPIPPLGHVMRELVYHSFLLISPKMELRAFR